MSRIFVTVAEKTAEGAIARMESLPAAIDGIELRVDAFSRPGAELNLAALRGATSKPLMYTRRAREKGERATTEELFAAAAAGFDLVDVEVAVEVDSVDLGWIPGISGFIGAWGEKIVMSYHDWEGVPPYLEQIVEQLAAWDFKLAVTPTSFDDNLRLLRALQRSAAKGGTTMFGMGAQGLYSRILAPFFGSDLTFVAPDAASVAAPGQLTLEQAEAIFGGAKNLAAPEALFAVIGSPAAHSRSPLIHNPIFRERGARAAYSIIETTDARRVFEGVASGEDLLPRGLSVTAPFKEEAFRFAQQRRAAISPRALRAKSVNTLVRMPDKSLQADSTDVAGFETLLGGLGAETALVVGAGGTARAALVALERLGIRATVVNRTGEKAALLAGEFGADYTDLNELGSQRADVIIDALPAAAGIELADAMTADSTLLVADYSSAVSRTAGRVIDGFALLQAQAIEQNALFMSALGEMR